MKKIFLIILILLSVKVYAINQNNIGMQTASGESIKTYDGALAGIDWFHYKIHKGDTYESCTINIDVADEAYLDVVISANVETHIVAIAAVEGKSYASIYKNITYTGGDALAKSNLRFSSSNTYDGVVIENPTISDLGTHITCELIVGETGPKSIGSTTQRPAEMIIEAGENLLVRVQNVAGLAKDLNVNILYYTEDD
jgi:hypothetical protein